MEHEHLLCHERTAFLWQLFPHCSEFHWHPLPKHLLNCLWLLANSWSFNHVLCVKASKWISVKMCLRRSPLSIFKICTLPSKVIFTIGTYNNPSVLIKRFNNKFLSCLKTWIFCYMGNSNSDFLLLLLWMNMSTTAAKTNKQRPPQKKQQRKDSKHFSKLLNYYFNSELQMYFISLVRKKRFTEVETKSLKMIEIYCIQTIK